LFALCLNLARARTAAGHGLRARDTIIKDGNADKAQQTMGNIFGDGEHTAITGQRYTDYYGSGYDKAFGKK
jgi:hypothetical protein